MVTVPTTYQRQRSESYRQALECDARSVDVNLTVPCDAIQIPATTDLTVVMAGEAASGTTFYSQLPAGIWEISAKTIKSGSGLCVALYR